MKTAWFYLLSVFLIIPIPQSLLTASGLEDFTHVPLRRKLTYTEEFYNLYRENLYRTTDNLNANAYWLQLALKTKFAPPVQALAKIETPAQWKKYKKLFHFHIYHLLTETNLRLGERFEKNNIYFFNYEFKKELLDGLEITKVFYKRADSFWKKAMELAKNLWEDRDIELYSIDGETDKWQDNVFKVMQSNLDVNYPKEINKRLAEVDKKIRMLQNNEFKK